jgi:CspA family cold shock protein
MPTGAVKWFSDSKGYGFIQADGGGGADHFVHITAVEKSGMDTLREGERLSYDLVPGKSGKQSAENLKKIK